MKIDKLMSMTEHEDLITHTLHLSFYLNLNKPISVDMKSTPLSQAVIILLVHRQISITKSFKNCVDALILKANAMSYKITIHFRFW